MLRRAQTKDPRKQVSARIFEDVHYRLSILAAKDKRTIQDLVNEALEAYLKKRQA